MGYILNLIPIIIVAIILIATKSFSFLKCFWIMLVVNAFFEALKRQTKFGILYFSPLASQRSVVENKILNNKANLLDRFIYFIFTFLAIFTSSWEFYIATAIYSLITLGIYNLFFK